MKRNSIYIYLARLDKEGIKVITSFAHNTKVYPTRVKDLESTGLPKDVQSKIASEYSKNKMTHELFIESAASFEDLKKSLAERGFNKLPLQHFSEHTRVSHINKNSLVTKSSTMVQRSSRSR